MSNIGLLTQFSSKNFHNCSPRKKVLFKSDCKSGFLSFCYVTPSRFSLVVRPSVLPKDSLPFP